MTSVIDVCNQALDLIRARATVTSIDPSDGSLAANILSRQYQNRIDALFRAAHWNCARYQSGLTLLKAARGTPENLNGVTPVPPMPWAYEYAWPSQPYCLKPRYIVPIWPVTAVNASSVPFTTSGGTMMTPYSGVEAPFITSSDVDANGNQIRVILTNVPQAQLVYTARIDDPDLWDSNFLDAAVALLASWICEPITGNNQLAAKSVALATELVRQARMSDGNEGTSVVDNTPDWIQIRMSRPVGMNTASALIGWDSLSMPGGSVF